MRYWLAPLLAAATFFTGCGATEIRWDPPRMTPRIFGGDIVEVGDTVQLSLLNLSYENVFSPTSHSVASALWTVSPANLARITPVFMIGRDSGSLSTAGAVVLGMTVGQGTISARGDAGVASINVRVFPRIVNFSIVPNGAEMAVGDTLKVVCNVEYENGARVTDPQYGCRSIAYNPGGEFVNTIQRGDSTWMIALRPGVVSFGAWVLKRKINADFIIR